MQPRERMLSAMVQLVGEQGYCTTTVADVIARAGASRRTFYQHFANRQACFLAAGDDVADTLSRRLTAVLEDAKIEGEDPIEALVGEIFQVAITSPATVRLLTAELIAAGPSGIETRERLMRELGGALSQALVHDQAAETGAPGTFDETLAGALLRIPYALALRTGRRRSLQRGNLSALIPDVARWVSAIRSGHLPPLLDTDPPPIGGRAPGTLLQSVGVPRGAVRSENVSSSLMVHSQRERLLDALANLSAAKGYGAVTIPEIVSEAGVSVEAFYGHFASRDDALLVAYELGHRKALAQIVRGSSTHDAVDAVRVGLETLLGFLASEPAYAHLALLDVPAAGSKIAALAQAGMSAYVELIGSAARSIHPAPIPDVFAEASVSAVQELCCMYVVRSETASLPRLLEQAEHLILAPIRDAPH